MYGRENLLKNEKSANGGINAKGLQAVWNNDYLLTILKSRNEITLIVGVASGSFEMVWAIIFHL